MLRKLASNFIQFQAGKLTAGPPPSPPQPRRELEQLLVKKPS